MDQQFNQSPDNLIVPTPAPGSGGPFVDPGQTASGIPIPAVKVKKKHPYRPLISGFVVLILSGLSFFVYQQLNNTPEIVFARAMAKLANDKSVSEQTTINVALTGQLLPFGALLQSAASTTEINASLTNFTNHSIPSQPEQSLKVDYELSHPDDFTDYKGHLEMRQLGSNLYYQINDALFSPSLGIEALPDQWILTSRDVATTTQQNADVLNFLNSSDSDALTNFVVSVNLFKTKQQLQQMADFSFLPDQTIDGVGCSQISIKLSQQQLKNLVTSLVQKGVLPETNNPNANDLINEFQGANAVFWVSKQDQSFKKIAVNFSFTGSGGTVKFNIVSSNFNFNPSDSVNAPEGALDLSAADGISAQEQTLSSQQNLQGFNLMNQGQNSQAKPIFEQAISTDHDNYHAYNSLGLINSQNGNLSQAITLFNQALGIYPQHDNAASNLIDAYYNAKNYQDAEETGIKFLHVFPQSQFISHVYWVLGITYGAENNTDLAIQTLQDGVSQDPQNHYNYSSYDQIGMYYEVLKQYDKAVENFRQSVNLAKINQTDKPTTELIYGDLVGAYIEEKQYDQARAAGLEELKYNPSLASDPSYQELVSGINIAQKANP